MRDYQTLMKAALVAHRNGMVKEFLDGLGDEERDTFCAGLGLDVEKINGVVSSLVKVIQETVVPMFENFAKVLSEDPAFQAYMEEQRKIENAKMN